MSTAGGIEELGDTRDAAAIRAVAHRRATSPIVQAIASLTWDDGSQVAVYERTLWGRNPERETDAITVTVRDETLSLSKTHFEIDGDGDGAWIIDKYSKNGTVLVRGDARIPLIPGLATTLRVGDRIEFGDRSAVVGEDK